MKKLLIGIIIGAGLTLGAYAVSQDKMQIRTFESPCMDINSLDKVLTEYNELPVLRADSVRKGEDDYIKHVTVLYMNIETSSWTLAEKMNDNLYCIISVGTGIAPVEKEIRDKIQKGRKNNQM